MQKEREAILQNLTLDLTTSAICDTFMLGKNSSTAVPN